MATSRFSAIRGGSDFGPEIIGWFNGGLFDDNVPLPLDQDDIRLLLGLAEQDWSAIEPSIFGTLFERGLDPDKRSQLGAHYTDRKSIERIVFPAVLDPLTQEWQQNLERISLFRRRVSSKTSLQRRQDCRKKERRQRNRQPRHSKNADTVYRAFLARLASVRVLYPACGSGQFFVCCPAGATWPRAPGHDRSGVTRLAYPIPSSRAGSRNGD